MTLHRSALALVSLIALFTGAAHAGRDESLIQQTRKNQLAHEAMLKKAELDKQKDPQKAQQVQHAPAQPATATTAAGGPQH